MTTPDETTLTLWMDGQLTGEEFERMEAWAQDHPELLAERDAVRAMSLDVKAAIPNSVEPPYPDFFNQRIINAIQEEAPTAALSTQKTSGGFWRWLAAPIAAGAMAVCFYMGTQVAGNKIDQTTPIASTPTVYTPDTDVKADIYLDTNHHATVIVIEGLDDIPDDLEMAGNPPMENSGEVMVTTEQAY